MDYGALGLHFHKTCNETRGLRLGASLILLMAIAAHGNIPLKTLIGLLDFTWEFGVLQRHLLVLKTITSNL